LTQAIYQTKYTTIDYADAQLPKHFILALDSSWSMSNHWKGLLEAVHNFAMSKEQFSSVEHVTSCVVFDSTANVVLREVPLVTKTYDDVKSTGGGTNFAAAMGKVVELVENSPVALPVVVIFMSDGEASFPQKEMSNLMDTSWDKIESFWVVGFGQGAAVLQRMADTMEKDGVKKGVYKNPKQMEELKGQYMEIAKAT
jgi:uncharacterized protein with von Willebrand factor type A (vWA) domain